MKTRQEFILETLLPYFQDPSTCAWNESEERCEYLTSDDKKCAFGKHLREYDETYEGENADDLLKRDEDILTDEATAQNLSGKQWNTIQAVHDVWAKNKHSIGFINTIHVKGKILQCEQLCDVDLSELTKLVN